MSSSFVTQERGANAQPASGSGSRIRNGPLALWVIVCVGALLRVIALGHKSFWLDEIASVAISRRPAPVFWHFLWHDEGNMALYYVLLKPWLHLGYGEATVRLLSVIPGVLSIPTMYVLGKRLFGQNVGILGAALLAVNACAVAVSQEARAYSFVVLLILLSTYLFVRLIESPSYSLAFGYAFVAGLTAYFHYFGVLVPAAHAVSMFALPAKRRPWKPLFLAWAIIVLLTFPILWLIHAQDVGHISWLQPPSWLELYHLGVFLAADGGKAVGAVLLSLELALAGFFLAAFRSVWRDGNDALLRWRYALIASAVATPIVITLLASIARPAFYHRFLIICLPGWLLITAVGAAHIRLRACRTTAIISVCALSLATTAISYSRVTEDWRAAVMYLIANARPDDRVLYFQSVGQFAGESYRDWLPGGNISRPLAIGIDPGHTDLQHDVGHAARVWLVLYRAEPGDAEARAIEQELSQRYAVGGQENFRGVTVVEYNAK